MKLILQQRDAGEDEVIVRYQGMNEQIKAIVSIVQGTEQKIMGYWEDQTLLLRPEVIYYLENVDGVTYAYLEDKVVRIPQSLKFLEACYGSRGFFRCSKSMVLNIYKISYLKSEPCSRIRATMENEEQVIISRKYASKLRQVLKGGGRDEG